MIEAKSSFEDSGYDCDHCGGRVLIRTDKETGQPVQQCYQCEACGCQWELSGGVLRVGHSTKCKQAQRERAAVRENSQLLPFSPIFLIVGYVVLLILLLFVGGIVAIRFLIPITIAVVVALAAFRLGKEKMWW